MTSVHMYTYNTFFLNVYTNVLSYSEKNVKVSKCIIMPTNPVVLFTDGGINNGRSNVMMKCNCFDTEPQEIKWYSPDEKEITLTYSRPDGAPYLVQRNGTLIFPIFNSSYQGTYLCGIGYDSPFVANISLKLWTGMCLMFYSSALYRVPKLSPTVLLKCNVALALK